MKIKFLKKKLTNFKIKFKLLVKIKYNVIQIATKKKKNIYKK